MKQKGLTLVELMVTLAVAIVLMSVGVPMYQNMVANNRAVTQVNMLVSAFQTARSVAVSRASNLVVCARSTDTSCGGGGDWANGWLVFEDDGSSVGSYDVGEDMLRVVGALPAGSNVVPQGGVASLRFGATGDVSAAENFELSVDNTRGDQTRCVLINMLGQVRLDRNSCP